VGGQLLLLLLPLLLLLLLTLMPVVVLGLQLEKGSGDVQLLMTTDFIISALSRVVGLVSKQRPNLVFCAL
jgi:hypothetical protein